MMNRKLILMTAGVLFLLLAAGNVFAQPRPSVFLKVGARVPNAQVYVDGRLIGTAPVEVRLPLGRYTVKVVAPGYEEFVKTIDLRRDEGFVADLQPRVRRYPINITANVPGAQVSIDNAVVGRVPFRGMVEEGEHTVRVTADGFEEYSTTVAVRDALRLHAELRRRVRMFTLSITANVDQARVSVNGEMQNGTAPMDLRLPEGQYNIKVTRRGYGSYETTVVLNRDQRIDARLVAPKARIIILGPERRGPAAPRFDVWIDGRKMSGSVFEVEQGRHTVRVEACGLVAEREVNCREGRAYRFKLDLDLQAPHEADIDDDGGPGGHGGR